MKNFNRRDKYTDFDELQDIETLAMQKNRCMIKTGKLMPTLWFMQDSGRKLRELTPDDMEISGVTLEYNILTFYKRNHVTKEN